MNEKLIPIIPLKPKLDPLSTVCDLKWNYPIFNMDRGEFRSCCRTPPKQITANDLEQNGPNAFLNSADQIASRLDLIQGRRHSDCNTCWKLEDSGMTSPRQGGNKFWDHMQVRHQVPPNMEYSEETLKVELSKINSLDHVALKSNLPYMLEISLGNTCDMKCMYCSHHYSTQWGTERIKWGEITQEQYDNEFPKAPEKFDETFWKWFGTARLHLNRIGIIGGEPLIMPEFYTFVERLIESVSQVSHMRSKKISFWIVTNMNTPPNYLEKLIKFMPRLTEVFNVEILVSMEATEKKAEYIRNGVSWTKFTSNIEKLLSNKDLKFSIGFIISVNVLSVSSIKEFVQYAEGLYRRYGRPVALKHNIVSYPDWQSPFILTPDFADYVDDCIAYMKPLTDEMPVTTDYYGRWDQYILFLESLANSIRNTTDDKTYLRKAFVHWFETYDHRRKLNLVETFPEYAEFHSMCKAL